MADDPWRQYNAEYTQARVLSITEVDTYIRVTAKLGRDHVRESLDMSHLAIKLITARIAVHPEVVTKFREGMLTLAGALVTPDVQPPKPV